MVLGPPYYALPTEQSRSCGGGGFRSGAPRYLRSPAPTRPRAAIRRLWRRNPTGLVDERASFGARSSAMFMRSRTASGLKQRFRDGLADASDLVILHAGLHDREQALEWLALALTLLAQMEAATGYRPWFAARLATVRGGEPARLDFVFSLALDLAFRVR
jgi:hypothetical protein